MRSLKEAIAAYSDTPEAHKHIWDSFQARVQATPYLREHRNVVENGEYGYGDRPYHWLWKLLAEEAGDEYQFLEIGVFQGQTISLAQLCAQKAGKKFKIVGVTPLSRIGDQFATHPDLDYAHRIKELHVAFDLRPPTILKGLSFDPRIQLLAREEGPYDTVYIDGCHDYDVVVDDINVYAPMAKIGGYVVIDDAANYLNIPDDLIPLNWRGIHDVSNAVRDTIEKDARFKHVLSVGHNRVFQRVV